MIRRWTAHFLMNTGEEEQLAKSARYCADAALLLGSVGLLSWGLHIQAWTSIVAGYVPTSPRAALGFVVAAVALRTYLSPATRGGALNSIVSFVLIGIGAGTLFEFFTGNPVSVERRLQALGILGGSNFAVELSPISAVCFIFTGAAALMLNVNRPSLWMHIAPSLGITVLAVNFVVLLGYLYGTPLLYGGQIRPVGILSGCGFCIVGLGVVAAGGNERFPLASLKGSSVKARLLRTFLPLTFLVVLFGELCSDLLRALPITNPALLDAIQTVVSAVVVTFAISRVAGLIGADLDHAEAGRKQAEEALRLAHDELEVRVDDRTRELAVANQQLRASEAKHRALLSAIPDWMFRLRKDHMVLDSKIPKDAPIPAAETDWSGKPIDCVLPPHVLQQSLRYFDRTIQTGEMQTFEFQFPLRDDVRDFEARVVASGNDEVLGIMRDITDRKRLEKEILEISNREQARIGQDLHDGLGQHLTGVAFMTKILEESLAEKDLPETAQALAIRQSVTQAISWTRKLSRGLFHVEIDGPGLVQAVRELTEEVSRTYKLKCLFSSSGPIQLDDREAALQLYRITQEAINNAVKHANPSEIRVGLDADARWLRLTIRDNGIGFSDSCRNGPGMGLRIMQYRAKSISAALAISRVPDGTLVTCSLLHNS